MKTSVGTRKLLQAIWKNSCKKMNFSEIAELEKELRRLKAERRAALRGRKFYFLFYVAGQRYENECYPLTRVCSIITTGQLAEAFMGAVEIFMRSKPKPKKVSLIINRVTAKDFNYPQSPFIHEGTKEEDYLRGLEPVVHASQEIKVDGLTIALKNYLLLE